jgi:phospholipid/cholesterol/gamma-HCH transport system ATP-binding protein
MSAEKPIVELQHVRHGFTDLLVHKDVSFAVKPGEIVTLLGPSGAGKTVILKLIIGLLMPEAGDVLVFGESMPRMQRPKRRLFRKNIGMLFQGAALFDSLSVFENVAYALREFGETDEQKISDIVGYCLSIIGLPGVSHKYPPQLSGGQKKRVGLARALALSPKIMLFDEPTTGLDPTATLLIDNLILKLRDQFGITSIAVTHDIESARRISDRWIMINKGLVVADGSVKQLLKSSPEVIAFTSGQMSDDL